MEAESTKGDGKPVFGKAASEIPALKPYRGKPAVRNFRGDGGNAGIIEARLAPPSYSTAGTLGARIPSAYLSSGRSLKMDYGRRRREHFLEIIMLDSLYY
jgi:hypothetical protein